MNSPRGYLVEGYISSSQLRTWKENPEKYIKQYIRGEQQFTSKYMTYGSDIHKQLETAKFSDEVLDFISLQLPDMPEKEFEINVPFSKTRIMGKFDGLDVSKNIVYDYKTGKAGTWTQEKLDEDIQMMFYGKLCYEQYGVYFTVKVVHLVTEEIDGEVKLTGDFHIFEKVITSKDIKKIDKLLNEFIAWADGLTIDQLEPVEIPEDVMHDMSKLAVIKEIIESKTKLFEETKALLDEKLKSLNIPEVKSEFGSAFYVRKTIYEYPKSIVSLEEKIEEKKKLLKKKKEVFESKNEPKEVKKTLNFRPAKKDESSN